MEVEKELQLAVLSLLEVTLAGVTMEQLRGETLCISLT